MMPYMHGIEIDSKDHLEQIAKRIAAIGAWVPSANEELVQIDKPFRKLAFELWNAANLDNDELVDKLLAAILGIANIPKPPGPMRQEVSIVDNR